MDMREIVLALRAAWWLPALGLAAGIAGAAAFSLWQTPLYSAHTQFFVSTPDSSSTSDAFQGSQLSEQRVTSYAQLIPGEELAGRVVDRLDLSISAQELSSRITATAIVDTVLIDVTVSDPSPRQAQRIAEAVGAEFTAFASELERTDADGASPIKVTVTDKPEEPDSPSSPQTVRNTLVGALVGLLLGTGFALVRARLDRTVKSSDDVAGLTGAPVIGSVLRDEALERQHVISRVDSGRAAEDYRRLRTNLQFLSVDRPPKIIMISSSVPSEGKTTVAVNLGLALAQSGKRVTILEADLRRPKVTRYLGMVGGVGLTNILAGTADVEEVTQVYGDSGLSVIAAGPTPPNPGELLSSSHMAALIEKLREANDYVLIDAPPLLPVADATGLAALVDGVLLSVRYGGTTTDQLREAALALQRVGSTVLGAILNIVPPKSESAIASGYSYSYDGDSTKSR